MTDTVLYLALAVAGLALASAVHQARSVLTAPPGDEPMVELSAAVRRGAMAFMGREYAWASTVVVVVGVLLAVLFDWGRPWGAIAYLIGALGAALAGYIGVRVATLAGTRSAEAARTGGAAAAFPIGIRGGVVAGLVMTGVALLGIGLGLLLFKQVLDLSYWPNMLFAMVLGGSTVALFTRIGGGIYTKATDMGAEGMEVEIPEGDRRHPAAIADLVGANVAGVAAVGADVFESYLAALAAAMAYATLVFDDQAFLDDLIVFPIALAGLGMLAAVVGSYLLRARSEHHLASALNRGVYFSLAVTAAGAVGLGQLVFEGTLAHPLGLGAAAAVGLLMGWLVGKISEWFTTDHHKTVKEIARQSQSGAANVVITGTAEGMRSAAVSLLVLAVGGGAAFYAGDWALGAGGGFYGVTLAAIGVVATLPLFLSLNAYSPIVDNAAGIAAMAGSPAETRDAVATLGSVATTTAAVARGIALASASITALALLIAFARSAGPASIDLARGAVLTGLLVGAMVPFLVAALAMTAASRVAHRVIDEVRRQLTEMPGPVSSGGAATPDYQRIVEVAAVGSLREMPAPAALIVALPLIVGYAGVEVLGGLLAGALVTGSLLAWFTDNAGNAWENARALVEAGAFGGEGSQAHDAMVIAHSVGGSFMDAVVPAMTTLIKLMIILSLVFGPAFAA